MLIKTCGHCNVEKLAADFYRSKVDKSGLQSWCKKCQRPERAKWMRDKHQARTEEEKETIRASGRAHRRAHREQFAAYAATQRETQWAKYLLSCAVRSRRTRSKTPRREFDLTEEYILSLYKAQNGLCHWFGIPLVPSGTKRDPYRPSIDRLDCSKGYTRDNVVLCCMAANFARCDMPVETFRQFVSFLFEHARSRVA